MGQHSLLAELWRVIDEEVDDDVTSRGLEENTHDFYCVVKYETVLIVNCALLQSAVSIAQIHVPKHVYSSLTSSSPHKSRGSSLAIDRSVGIGAQTRLFVGAPHTRHSQPNQGLLPCFVSEVRFIPTQGIPIYKFRHLKS